MGSEGKFQVLREGTGVVVPGRLLCSIVCSLRGQGEQVNHCGDIRAGDRFLVRNSRGNIIVDSPDILDELEEDIRIIRFQEYANRVE